MTRAGPLSWATGLGWFVLHGGRGPQGEGQAQIDDRILALADFSRPIVYLPTAGESPAVGESILEDYASLGAPRGYVVPVFEEAGARREENCTLLAEAGVVILGDGDALRLVRVLKDSLALRGIAEAFISGAVIAGVGAGAACMGERLVRADGPDGSEQGWGWVESAVIIPRFTGSAQQSDLQALLRARPGLIGLGIPQETALALGPQGEVETWGLSEATVVVAR